MARTVEPTVTTDEIVFELERFELDERERLTLSGRWFGVRGRRFVRPTLTLEVEGERIRALADLEDKPWPAEDGEPWQASFPWRRASQGSDAELSVAPDITLELPSPGSRSRASRRLLAQPRREAMSASWGEFAVAGVTDGEDQAGHVSISPEVASVEVASPEAATTVDASLEAAVPDLPEVDAEAEELVALRSEVRELRSALGSARDDLSTASAQLISALGELEARADALASVRSELDAAQSVLDSATTALEARERQLEATKADLAVATADRDAAIGAAGEAGADRDTALQRAESLAAQLEEARAAEQRARAELERSVRERDDAIAAHGAAMVMRGATRAQGQHEHARWPARGLALLLLAGAVLVLLLVLHVL